MRNRLLGVFLSFMLVVAAPLTAAELKGQVLRGNGAPAANVTITLTGPGEQKQTQTTNGSGFYRFSNIPAGAYTLAIEDRREQVTVPPQGTERNYRVK
jgi:hypothetical protein